MNEEEKMQLIEKYVLKRLSQEQGLAFEQHLKEDVALVEEVELFKTIVKGINLDGKLNAFQKHLKSLDNNSINIDNLNKGSIINLKPGLITLPWKWIAGIAAVLAISIGSFWYINANSNTALFSKYYQSYRSSVQLSILRGDSVKSLEQQAIQAYEDQNYQQAARLIQEVIDKNPEEISWSFFLGLAYLELNELKSAEENLYTVAKNSQSIYYKQAQWYLALTYLKKDEKNKSRMVLESLERQKGVYGPKAKQLLAEI